MVDLSEFLEARLAEIEQVALAATSGPWRYNPGKEWFTDPRMLEYARRGVPVPGGEEFVGAGPDDGDNRTTLCVAARGASDDIEAMSNAAHIAQHDPDFVLADVAAKRAIIREHSPFGYEDDGTPDPYSTDRDRLYCSGCGFNGIEEKSCLIADCVTLRALAGSFADHPDYDLAWRL